jgi:antirestriction protein ArdC
MKLSANVRQIAVEIATIIEGWQTDGVVPAWRKSWNGSPPSLPVRGGSILQGSYPKFTGIDRVPEEFTGGNLLLLWIATHDRQYASSLWFTYKQMSTVCRVAGVAEPTRLKYGTGTQVLRPNLKKVTDEVDGKEVTRVFPVSFSTYEVFNLEQFDSYPASLVPKPIETSPVERDTRTDTYLANCGASIEHHGTKAFYRPSADQIVLPPTASFRSTADYYATSIHEHIHWTGHASRLDRLYKLADGQRDYAKEELVAELGSAFVCSRLGIETEELRQDHAKYLAAWLRNLKDDFHFFWQAASHATKALGYLDALQK